MTLVILRRGPRPTSRHPAAVRAREHRRRYPERQRARDEARRLIDRGEIVLGPCVFGPSDCRGATCAHHPDYRKPREVIPVCRAHHWLADLLLRVATERRAA